MSLDMSFFLSTVGARVELTSLQIEIWLNIAFIRDEEKILIGFRHFVVYCASEYGEITISVQCV